MAHFLHFRDWNTLSFVFSIKKSDKEEIRTGKGGWSCLKAMRDVKVAQSFGVKLLVWIDEGLEEAGEEDKEVTTDLQLENDVQKLMKPINFRILPPTNDEETYLRDSISH